MEAVNGVTDGGPPPPSPLTGCYLLMVLGEPHSDRHKDIILQRLSKGLLSWDVNECLVDLEKELAIITEQALEGEEARHGERLIQFASENLVTEILIHPSVSTLAQCVRNLLSSFTRHRHIIHAGYSFAANGSWILQDGTFSYADFAEAFQEVEVQRVIRAYENGISVDVHCAPEGDWTKLPKEPFAKSCKLRVNPNDVLNSGSQSISSFANYVGPFLVPAELETLLESSDVVGNIRFSRPTLYVFPGGQGDAALFGINGFNMLLDGGFSRKACFWDFVRHLDRLDAVLLTRLNNSNVSGIGAVLKRKKENTVYPQIGHFFCNIQERKSLLSPDGDKDKDPLLINILEEGHDIVCNLRHLNLTPQVCYRDSEPINLYHKVGHGTLDMYVLSPAKESREVREFLQKWNSNDQKLFASSKPSPKEFAFPLQNVVSICALLVWRPANPNDTITRILFPGSSPQAKIFEGLDKLRQLEFIRHPICTELSLNPPIKTKQRDIIEKILQPEKKAENRKDRTPKQATENKLAENGVVTNGIISSDHEKTVVKKIDSTDSEKSATKPPKPEEKLKAKPKPETKTKQPRKKPQPVDKKITSPTTPKKTILNGDAKTKPTKPSPSATPAKSAKDANNRKVVESKIKSAGPKKEPPTKVQAAVEKKPERKPISRRPKPAGSPGRRANGVQKPDTLSKRGKLDKEGTTDSSTVSTPSADHESVLKKDISKLTPEEMQQLKAQELAELKEEQEAVKEIEAVFRKGEQVKETPQDVRKVKDEPIEQEEYLVIEKEEIERDSLEDKEVKEDETQKHARDSEESEKQRKLSEPKEKEQVKEVAVASPEGEKVDSTDKKEEVPPESQPEEKVSANLESGQTTTAPTLPEDERIPLDEIKEDNTDQVIEEKHVKEETKEKEIPVIQLPPKTFESVPKLPPVVGIRLDKQAHIRDIVKTPDEVADLPVHEEVDIEHYSYDVNQKGDKLPDNAKTLEKTEPEKEKSAPELNKKELSKSPDEEKDKDEFEAAPSPIKPDGVGEKSDTKAKLDAPEKAPSPEVKLDDDGKKSPPAAPKPDERKTPSPAKTDAVERKTPSPTKVESRKNSTIADKFDVHLEDIKKSPSPTKENAEEKVPSPVENDDKIDSRRSSATFDKLEDAAEFLEESQIPIPVKLEDQDKLEKSTSPSPAKIEEKKPLGGEETATVAEKLEDLEKESPGIDSKFEEHQDKHDEKKSPTPTNLDGKKGSLAADDKKSPIKTDGRKQSLIENESVDERKTPSPVKIEEQKPSTKLEDERKTPSPVKIDDSKQTDVNESLTPITNEDSRKSSLIHEDHVDKVNDEKSPSPAKTDSGKQSLIDERKTPSPVKIDDKVVNKSGTSPLAPEGHLDDEKSPPTDKVDSRKQSLIEVDHFDESKTPSAAKIEERKASVALDKFDEHLDEKEIKLDDRLEDNKLDSKTGSLIDGHLDEEKTATPAAFDSRKSSVIAEQDGDKTHSASPTKLESHLDESKLDEKKSPSPTDLLKGDERKTASPIDRKESISADLLDKQPPANLDSRKSSLAAEEKVDERKSATSSPVVARKESITIGNVIENHDERQSPLPDNLDERKSSLATGEKFDERKTSSPDVNRKGSITIESHDEVKSSIPDSRKSSLATGDKIDEIKTASPEATRKESITANKLDDLIERKSPSPSNLDSRKSSLATGEKLDEQKTSSPEVNRKDSLTIASHDERKSPLLDKLDSRRSSLATGEKLDERKTPSPEVARKNSIAVESHDERKSPLGSRKSSLATGEKLDERKTPSPDVNRKDSITTGSHDEGKSLLPDNLDGKKDTSVTIDKIDESKTASPEATRKESITANKLDDLLERKSPSPSNLDSRKSSLTIGEKLDERKTPSPDVNRKDSIAVESRDERMSPLAEHLDNSKSSLATGEKLDERKTPSPDVTRKESIVIDHEERKSPLPENLDSRKSSLATGEKVDERKTPSPDVNRKDSITVESRDERMSPLPENLDSRKSSLATGEKLDERKTPSPDVNRRDSIATDERMSLTEHLDSRKSSLASVDKIDESKTASPEAKRKESTTTSKLDDLIETGEKLDEKKTSPPDVNAKESTIIDDGKRKSPEKLDERKTPSPVKLDEELKEIEKLQLETKSEKTKQEEEEIKKLPTATEKPPSPSTLLRKSSPPSPTHPEPVGVLEQIDRDFAEKADKIQKYKDDLSKINEIDEKLQKLKEHAAVVVETFTTLEGPEHAESVVILESPMAEERKFQPDVIELGRKSPKEREQDVAKIVASVAEVLKSDAPLEEFEGKLPIVIPVGTEFTELRETHITTVESPVGEQERKIAQHSNKDVAAPIYEEDEEPHEAQPQSSKRSSLMRDSNELIQATTNMISQIKSSQSQESVKDSEDAGMVHRMLVTASSEDGGEEIEICPAGSITFSRSSESSGRSSPEQQKVSQVSSAIDSDSMTTVKTTAMEKDSGVEDLRSETEPAAAEETLIKSSAIEAQAVPKQIEPEGIFTGITDAVSKGIESIIESIEGGVEKLEGKTVEEPKRAGSEQIAELEVAPSEFKPAKSGLVEVFEDKVLEVGEKMDEKLLSFTEGVAKLQEDVTGKLGDLQATLAKDFTGFKEETVQTAGQIKEGILGDLKQTVSLQKEEALGKIEEVATKQKENVLGEIEEQKRGVLGKVDEVGKAISYKKDEVAAKIETISHKKDEVLGGIEAVSGKISDEIDHLQGVVSKQIAEQKEEVSSKIGKLEETVVHKKEEALSKLDEKVEQVLEHKGEVLEAASEKIGHLQDLAAKELTNLGEAFGNTTSTVAESVKGIGSSFNEIISSTSSFIAEEIGSALHVAQPEKKLSVSDVQISLKDDDPMTRSIMGEEMFHSAGPSAAPKEENLSGKSTPDIAEIERIKATSGHESAVPQLSDASEPGSPLSVTSQAAHSRSSSRYDFDESPKLHAQIDPMSASFYGALPPEPPEELMPTHLYEITKAKYEARFDPFEAWGKPLGLPSPAPPSDNNNKGTPKKERKVPMSVTAKNKLNDDKKRAESPSKYNRNKRVSPVYVDLTYVPHHGNAHYSYVDFFKRVRARYYVFSGIEPSREVYNALLEAKQTWDDKELEVTIIPTYDTDILGYWVAENEELLAKHKIDLSPSASRCTINLQDHETSCSAYRLEF